MIVFYLRNSKVYGISTVKKKPHILNFKSLFKQLENQPIYLLQLHTLTFIILNTNAVISEHMCVEGRGNGTIRN